MQGLREHDELQCDRDSVCLQAASSGTGDDVDHESCPHTGKADEAWAPEGDH